jgi:zinc transport system substrate-binding protein
MDISMRSPRLHTILSILSLAMLAGCDSGASSPTNPVRSQKISVLVTAYPLTDLLQRVGGKFVDVQWLIEAGQRPEEIEGNAELRQRANRATFIVTSGPWDLWAGSEITNETRMARLVQPEFMPAARPKPGSADDPYAAEAYLWLDPAVTRDMVEAVRARLTLIDPTLEDEFRDNAKACRSEVDAVDQELSHGLAQFAGREFLVVRPVWGALANRYGLTQVVPIWPRSGPDDPIREPTEERLRAEDLKEIARLARAKNLKTLFIDASTSAAIRQRIEEKTGLKTIGLDPLGTSAPDGRNTWAKLMRFNLEQLQKGLE